MRLITIFVAFSLLAEIASGQTTRPGAEAPARWERQVSSLAAAVVAHDQSTIQSLVGADCRIGKFNAVPDADGSQFLDALSSQTVLADHAYVYPPAEMVSDNTRIAGLRERLFFLLSSAMPGIALNGSLEKRIAGNLNLTFPGASAAALMRAVPELCVSTGSACSSRA